jgi:DMSO/TMAO reductase YedYZ molybdopterin-dependent catalytic subunit
MELNKTKTIAITVVAIVAVIAVVTASYYFAPSSAQTNLLPSGDPPEWQLEVAGEDTAGTSLTVDELVEMPLANVTNTIKGETAEYVGVSLLKFLNVTGASWDTGLITVTATDGYSKSLTYYQVWNSTQYPQEEIILAFVKDGQWMNSDNGGPIQMITPGLASSYNIKNVAEVQLDLWTIEVSGTAISEPLVITGENITDYETKTVQAAFAPGGGPQRTSDWTGADLWSILQAAGISETATTVTVTAIDGYSKEFTVAQVEETGMLIGYKENGEYFAPDGGRPFRLVLPNEEYKWGQYWVRWVSEIEVS